MPRRQDTLLLYQVACHYYRDGMSQDDIASRVGLSRSQISRVLDQARKAGIVRIEVKFPEEIETEEMAQSLAAELGLKKVFLSTAEKQQGKTPDERSIQSLGAYAASVLPEFFRESAVVGVGWGRTIYETALRFAYMDPPPGIRIVPLIGSAGQRAPWLQINGIVDRFSEKTKAESVFIRAQAFLEPAASVRSRAETENLSHISSLWDRVDLALVGLGKPADRADYLEGEMDPEVVERLSGMRTAGDILGRFFDSGGRLVDPGDKWNLVSLDLARLRSIRRVVCLACGSDKTEGIVAAAKAGYFDTLITDSDTAKAILTRREPP
jgi:DNA-binding transcriptional regulator LsrR (DeoR family)